MFDGANMKLPLAHANWDAVVVGAGPAGIMSSMQLVERGHSVLLVEAKRFPRDKVCGGCLNRRAWQALADANLSELLDKAGAVELSELSLVCGQRRALWSMPAMHAISRSTMDTVLLDEAKRRGVTVLMETQARIEPCEAGAATRSIKLKYRPSDGQILDDVVEAKVVLAADGLTHSSLGEEEQVASNVVPGSRVGLGATWTSSDQWYKPGRLTMVVGRSGYVGITCVEQGRINAAAALSLDSLRAGRSRGLVITGLLHECGMHIPDGCESAQWTGTPALTRESQQWSAHRLFLVGDAAGYVEPFTGEGMSWALAGAVEASRLADQAIGQWNDNLAAQWHGIWRKFVRSRQSTCRGLAWLLRRPGLAEFTLGAVSYTPWLANRIMQRVAG